MPLGGYVRRVGPGVVGAYVLAGELAANGGSHVTAFAAYEAIMRRYAGAGPTSMHAGTFMAPRTAPGLWLRNTLLQLKATQWLMLRMMSSASDVEVANCRELSSAT